MRVVGKLKYSSDMLFIYLLQKSILHPYGLEQNCVQTLPQPVISYIKALQISMVCLWHP
jgi:hypothetical protein